MTGRIRVLVSLTVLMLAVSGVARSATPPALVCKLPRDSTGTLPPTARHGIVNHLPQYPTVSLASARQQARARRILTELVAAADRGKWRDVRAATRAGYDTRSRARRSGDTSVFFFHAERHEEPRGRSIFDFTRPKALIYANAPGKPLVLVGAMWSTRDGEVGPTPAGPILRWHSHIVCKEGKKRGLKPPASWRLPCRAHDSSRVRARCSTSGSPAICGARSRSPLRSRSCAPSACSPATTASTCNQGRPTTRAGTRNDRRRALRPRAGGRSTSRRARRWARRPSAAT